MKKTLLVSAALLLMAGNAQAVPITVDFTYTIFEKDTCSLNNVISDEERHGYGSLTFENTVTSKYITPLYYITHFGQGEYSTDLSTFIPDDPYSNTNQVANAVFADERELAFPESYKRVGFALRTESNDGLWDGYTSSIQLLSQLPDSVGGKADFFTPEENLDFWTKGLMVEYGFSFSQSYYHYQSIGLPFPVNTGIHWSGYATILSVSEHQATAPVPEPATMLLFGTGLGVFSWLQRRRYVRSTR